MFRITITPRLFLASRRLAVITLVISLWPASPLLAQEERQSPQDRRVRLTRILEGLEHGMVALEQLECREELELLRRVADDVRGQLRSVEAGRRELEIARQQIEALKLARAALAEASRKDAADLCQWAIRAREVGLEGRRDAEAGEIRQRAPDRDQTIELLVFAEDLYRDELGMPDRAAKLSRMTEELWPRRSRPRQAERGGETEGAAARLENEIEVLELARGVLLETEKSKAADIMKRSIQVRQVDLRGLEGEEASHVRERAPRREEEIEVLAYASRLWRELGQARKAEQVGGLAERMSAGRGERPAQEEKQRVEVEARAERLKRLERRLDELQQAMAELREELRELRPRSVR